MSEVRRMVAAEGSNTDGTVETADRAVVHGGEVLVADDGWTAEWISNRSNGESLRKR